MYRNTDRTDLYTIRLPRTEISTKMNRKVRQVAKCIRQILYVTHFIFPNSEMWKISSGLG